MRKIVLSLLAILIMEQMMFAFNKEYHKPENPKVLEKIEQWQDYKFGLMMHWGHYSQHGIVESWSLCNEKWINRHLGPYENYGEYYKWYEKQMETFNPKDFNPKKWADAAEKAGMKYVVFTTKHHDGFCMFDTKTTDYKITGKNCAFSNNKKANITKEIFSEFQKKDFLIGAYFSKPDWHTEYYWWPYYAHGTRHVNYDPAKHPERWQNFKDYTYNQIEELMTNYGDVDILWLDGAWVRPNDNIPEEFEEWARYKNYNQDIDIPRIARMARKHQPGLMVVDRWVAGKYENYLTPENKVPDEALMVPWEACITMTGGWAYNKNQHYKSVHKLINIMVNIVAKNGNFLLNIAPSPEGDWVPDAYDRLAGIADWMAVNSEAIYGTKPIEPYDENKIRFTQKNGNLYAIYLPDEDETEIPPYININSFGPNKKTTVKLLGYNKPLKWEKNGKGLLINVPQPVTQNPPCDDAWVFRIENIIE